MAEQMVVRTRSETRATIQRLIQHHCAVRPLSIACDDDRAAALAEMVMRITEGKV